ncbi:MAG: hypothetical protein AAB358_03750 [Patescibacteria group bacterium]
MQPDKWQQLKGQLQDTFKDVEIKVEPLGEGPGEKEIVLFTGPLGKMKLEYTTRPMVVDKVTHGSRRIGSQTAVEYIYSDSEFSHQLKAFKWDDEQNDWLEIDMKESFKLD